MVKWLHLKAYGSKVPTTQEMSHAGWSEVNNSQVLHSGWIGLTSSTMWACDKQRHFSEIPLVSLCAEAAERVCVPQGNPFVGFVFLDGPVPSPSCRDIYLLNPFGPEDRHGVELWGCLISYTIVMQFVTKT